MLFKQNISAVQKAVRLMHTQAGFLPLASQREMRVGDPIVLLCRESSRGRGLSSGRPSHTHHSGSQFLMWPRTETLHFTNLLKCPVNKASECHVLKTVQSSVLMWAFTQNWVQRHSVSWATEGVCSALSLKRNKSFLLSVKYQKTWNVNLLWHKTYHTTLPNPEVPFQHCLLLRGLYGWLWSSKSTREKQ